jgi:hypothetical protein
MRKINCTYENCSDSKHHRRCRERKHINVFQKFEDRILRIDSNKLFIFACILVVLVLMVICIGAAILVTMLATS